MIPMLAALLIGAAAGSLLSPAPAGGESKEMIQLQQQVATLIQNQQDMRSAMDQESGQLKVLVEQSADSVNRVSNTVSQLEKTMQDVQASTGSRVDALTTQTQAISDNLQVVQSRVGKLSDQVTDVRNLLQNIDVKISGGTPADAGGNGSQQFSNPPNGGQPSSADNSQADNSQPPSDAQPSSDGGQPSGAPPPSAEVLYSTALRDFSGGSYDIAKQEFVDYLKNFPTAMLAGNARFYLGEIAYQQGDYHSAIAQYNSVIQNFPRSFKIAAAHLKKGEAYMALKQKPQAAREFKLVVQSYPGSDEARRAQERLNQLGVGR
jgi:tol-pal system protein YbgF